MPTHPTAPLRKPQPKRRPVEPPPFAKRRGTRSEANAGGCPKPNHPRRPNVIPHPRHSGESRNPAGAVIPMIKSSDNPILRQSLTIARARHTAFSWRHVSRSLVGGLMAGVGQYPQKMFSSLSIQIRVRELISVATQASITTRVATARSRYTVKSVFDHQVKYIFSLNLRN